MKARDNFGIANLGMYVHSMKDWCKNINIVFIDFLMLTTPTHVMIECFLPWIFSTPIYVTWLMFFLAKKSMSIKTVKEFMAVNNNERMASLLKALYVRNKALKPLERWYEMKQIVWEKKNGNWHFQRKKLWRWRTYFHVKLFLNYFGSLLKLTTMKVRPK